VTGEEVALAIIKVAVAASPIFASFMSDAVKMLHGHPFAGRIAEILPERSKSREVLDELSKG
jgi:hypothetical protein